MASAKPTHVPRFGNWDANDHAPYTKVFETARAGRGGKMINPNDPSQNPEAFIQQPAAAAPGGGPRRARPDRNSREEGDYKRYMESPARRPAAPGRSASNSNRSPLHHQAQPAKVEKPSPALPKFGDWDAKDPSSGEGFTMIFNNARNERQVGGPGRVPPMSNLQQQEQHKNHPPKRNNGSWFCCCFS